MKFSSKRVQSYETSTLQTLCTQLCPLPLIHSSLAIQNTHMIDIGRGLCFRYPQPSNVTVENTARSGAYSDTVHDNTDGPVRIY